MSIPNSARSLGDFERVVLLAIYRLGSAAYGTSIMEEIEGIEQKEPSLGATYTALKRLEKKGYVATKLGEPTPERGGRAKRYFNITASGQDALKRSLDELQKVHNRIKHLGVMV